MPERTIDTELWGSDEWFQELSISQRYLFFYLWTNDHCKGGLYYLTLNTMTNETKIPKDELPDLLLSLEPKVTWYQEENLIWVKNFIKRQYKSPTFLAGVAKSLLSIRNEQVIQELLDYNKERYGLIIPYDHYKEKRKQSSAEPAVQSSDIIDPELAELVKYFENKISQLSPTMFERLRDDLKEYGADQVKKAIDEAVLNRVHNLKYIEKILENWKNGETRGHSQKAESEGSLSDSIGRPLT